MANLSLRVPDDLLARFDAAAGGQGGRAPTLRRLMDQAAAGPPAVGERLPARPLKLTVRLTAHDGDGLAREASGMGLTPNAWVAALIRHRLHGKPTFGRDETVALLAIQGEVRRIGVNVNQIARALNTAIMEGKVLDLEIAYLDALRTELRAHIFTLREAFEGNLAYWAVEP
ncbi:MobC family plasmid mobilization relaxosome protein [Phenylobacterium sp.]|uniref:MobC family plasmid mobilization relaxosome protein n=1 Tax=Phenylobacterium sp. TaxID=1871053 RepID=UPI003BADA6A4